jgi:hypothetical protein
MNAEQTIGTPRQQSIARISQTQQTATALLQHPEGNEGPKLQITDTMHTKGLAKETIQWKQPAIDVLR